MEGILLVNKEKGKTSRDMVNELNHIFGMKKIGHTGTLDPIATGVLVMCLGKYTKMVDMLSSIKKEYIAQIKLGIKTDTGDITGNIIASRKTRKITKDEIVGVFKKKLGKQMQTIPLYSAKKINGKKLYEYAREKVDVELPTNEIEIYEMELLDITDDIIEFRTVVSKGTYIRSLIEMLCDDLKIVGTMNNLIRTKQGICSLDDCSTIEDIKQGNYKLLRAQDFFNYPVYELTNEEYLLIKNGNKIKINSDRDFLIFTKDTREVAIYCRENEVYRPKIMLI